MLNVEALTREAKVEEALKRGVRLLPGNLAAQMEAMLTPTALTMLVGSIVALAIAQVFGVGEIADLFLLGIGLGFCSWGIFDGLHDLERFANTAMQARTEADLDRAAKYFASAVTKLGVNAVMAFLLKKPIRTFKEIEGFKLRNVQPGLEAVKPPPPAGVKPTVSYEQLDPSLYGYADEYGSIKINTRFSPKDQQETLDHESVHAFFSPKFGPFRQVRAQLAISGYSRSPLLRYLEEAMAESYSQARANGFRGIITGIKFPIKNGYISAEEMSVGQGVFIGTISIEGHMLRVTVSHGQQTPGSQNQPGAPKQN